MSVYSHLRIDKFQKMIDDIRPLEMDIALERPQDGFEVSDYVVEIGGQVRIKSTAHPSRSDINLEIAKRNIDIVPMVRPLSETNVWFAQTKPIIGRDGSFQGSAYIGDKKGRGIGVTFQIVVVAVPKGTVRQGDTFRDLSVYGASSRVVTVKRVQK